jgi:hypothetical protein
VCFQATAGASAAHAVLRAAGLPGVRTEQAAAAAHGGERQPVVGRFCHRVLRGRRHPHVHLLPRGRPQALQSVFCHLILRLIGTNRCLFCSDRTDADPALLPQHLQRRRDRALLQPAPPQGVVSQHEHHPRLRPVLHGHAPRQTPFHKGVTKKAFDQVFLVHLQIISTLPVDFQI